MEITFQRAELLDDIEHIAWIEADAMPAEAEHARHILRDICQDANADRVSRSMTSAAAIVDDLLHPLTDIPAVADGALDDTLGEPDGYVLRLAFADTFPRAAASAMAALGHDYIVYSALLPWISLCWPQRAEYYMLRMRQIIDKLRDLRDRDTDTLWRRPMFPV